MRDQVSTAPFKALASSLKAGGFAAHGDRLEGILDGSWTTSTELLAELGTAVIAVRKECGPLSAERKALVAECLRQVRQAWPGFGFFSWLPFKR